jgi:foldase protein PrsA
MDLKKNLLLLMIEEAFLHKYTERQKTTLEQTEMTKAENLLLKEYEEADEAVKSSGVDLAQWRSTLGDHLRTEMVLNNILKEIEVDETESLRYFLDHRELFVQPREVRIIQIVVARSEEAIEIMDKLKKGEDFKTLAEKYSRSPDGKSGGDLGFLGPGQLPPEIEEAAFSLKVGELSDAIPSPYGFHILRVKARREPKPLTYPEVKERIRKMLLGEKVQRVYETWLENQWTEAQIKILDPALQSVLKQTEQRT